MLTVVALLTAVLPVVLTAAPASAALLNVSYTLEGCNLDHGGTFNQGTILCSDNAYTTGNLGKSWAELDLVPMRVTLDNKNGGAVSGNFVVAGDYKNGAGTATGWDVISALTKNAAKSSATCPAVTSGAQQITPSGQGAGGADQTIYRIITTSLPAGVKCVYDYYMRLALGAHLFSGSSLQANLWNEQLTSSGIGEKRISIPVAEIAPQELHKDMSATRGQTNVWDVSKSANPATLSFSNTCSGVSGDLSKSVTVTVTWHKVATTGDTTIITHVYATNPSHRDITVAVEDKVYEGSTQTTQVGTTGTASVNVPANNEVLVLTHTFSTSSTATSFNDVATATYTDTITGIPVPGTTQATASANLQTTSGGADTAVISDSESLTEDNGGTHLSFSVDSTSGASGHLTTGAAYPGGSTYTLGTKTTGPVYFVSAEQSGDGSVTFNKTVYVDGPAETSGSLDDTATITDSSGGTSSATGSTSIESHASVTLTIEKTIPNVLDGNETATFQFHVTDSGDNEDAAPSLTFGAGDIKKSVDVTLDPDDYTVSEDDPDGANFGWQPQIDQSADLNLPTCSAKVTFDNSFDGARAKASKVTDPANSDYPWSLSLTGPDTDTQSVSDANYAFFAPTSLSEGSYTIGETEKTGYKLTNVTGTNVTASLANKNCTFTVDYPADFGKVFACQFTNTKQGKAKVIKTVGGSAPSGTDSFTFQIRSGASTTQAGTILETGTATAGNGGVIEFATLLVPGATYQLCETVMPGWTTTLGPPFFTVYNPSGDNSVVCTDFTVSAGETKTFTIDNGRPPGGLARTIGFWKNWASCAPSGPGKGQKPVLDTTLSLGAILIGELSVATCPVALDILDKRLIKSPALVYDGKKQASDPAFGLAAQLLAAKLNVQAGAGVCPAAVTAINDAQTLLAAIHFDGSNTDGDPAHSTMSSAQKTSANNLANTLDRYNNNLLC
jgi:hypothetical protein